MYLLECLANNGDCAFYEEVQSVMQCSPGGYPIDFGLRYCRRFKEAEGAFSKEVINLEKSVKGLAMYDLNIQNSFQGRKWVGDVRKCLMRKLLPVFCPERHDKFKTWYEEVMKAKSSLSDITPFFSPSPVPLCMHFSAALEKTAYRSHSKCYYLDGRLCQVMPEVSKLAIKRSRRIVSSSMPATIRSLVSWTHNLFSFLPCCVIDPSEAELRVPRGDFRRLAERRHQLRKLQPGAEGRSINMSIVVKRGP